MNEGARGRAIFISYRRDDSEGESGRLYDDLVRAYGDASVFMDVAGIQPGLDFRRAIDDNVAACGVLLAVIGPAWATITGHDGTRRLDNPEDYVRLEIASALKRGIPVIPVLVHDAHMPALEQLPDDLKDLRYRNSVELTHARWNSDVPLLISALKTYVEATPAHPEATVHATVPVQLPAPTPKPPEAKQRPPFSLGLALGALAVAICLIAVFFFVLRPRWQSQHEAAVSTSPAYTTTSAIPTAPTATNTSTTSPVPTVSPAVTTSKVAPTPNTTTPVAPSSATIPVGMIGIWRSEEKNAPQSDGLDRLVIVQSGSRFSIQAWGACPGKLCDWGMRQLILDNGNATIQMPWQPRNTDKETSLQRKVSVSLALSGETLIVTAKNEWVDPSRGTVSNKIDRPFKKVQ